METPVLRPELVARLEAAAIRAWPATIERHTPTGWVLRATPGLDRGRSNNALTPCRSLASPEIDAGIVQVEAFAAEHGIRPGIQVSPLDLHEPLIRILDDRDWETRWPTLVLVGPAGAPDPIPSNGLHTEDHASDEWLTAWARCEPGQDIEAHKRTVFARLAASRTGAAKFVRLGNDAAVGIGVEEDGLLGLYCIAVDPAVRRTGLGTTLIRALIAESSATVAYLQVEERNIAAIRMYRRLGFTEAYRYCHRVAPVPSL
jgi:N-acetylglutamate synthase